MDDKEEPRYPAHTCQFCGSDRKLVETVIDDEFVWNEREKRYDPEEFSDMFEHSGVERCALCGRDWTGWFELRS